MKFDFEVRGFVESELYLDYIMQQTYTMFSVQDMINSVRDILNTVIVSQHQPTKDSLSLSIQELFIDVHQCLKDEEKETRLRKEALLPPVLPPRPKTTPQEGRSSILGVYNIVWDSKTAPEAKIRLRKYCGSVSPPHRKKFIDELQKPGQGVGTMDFVTMGMFIIDSILVPPLRESVLDVMGGAGTYAVIGARFFRKPPSSRLIGSVVHVGSDFPDTLTDEINSWKTYCVFIDTPDRPTTRGVNHYNSSGHHSFQYFTEKFQVQPMHLAKQHLQSKTFHLMCSPKRCIDIVNGILRERAKSVPSEIRERSNMRPIFVWEPVPVSCKPSELENFLEALKYVDVLSPNLLELNSLFEEAPDEDKRLDDHTLKQRCNVLLAKGFGVKPSAIVVRLGERGCYVAQMMRHIFLPPYHRPRNDLNETEQYTWTEKVADPTGGGNAFLGAYCIGLLTEPNPLCLTEFEMAAVYGSVAASFVIEQFGMPKLSIRESDGQELWNGESAHDRMNIYERKLHVPKLTKKQIQQASLYVNASALLHRALHENGRQALNIMVRKADLPKGYQ